MPTFTVRPGIYLTPTGDPATATQRWHRDGVEIVGASGTSYTTASPADDGKLIEYVEDVANLAGSAAEQRLTLQAAAPFAPSTVQFRDAYLQMYNDFDSSRPFGPSAAYTNKATVALRFTRVAGPELLYSEILSSGAGDILGGHWSGAGKVYFSTNPAFGGGDVFFSDSDAIGVPVSIMVAADGDGGLPGGKSLIVRAKVGSNPDAELFSSTTLTATPFPPVRIMGAGFGGGNTGLSFDLQDWVWATRAALDPAVYWSTFFNADGSVKWLGLTGTANGALPAPDYYQTGSDFAGSGATLPHRGPQGTVSRARTPLTVVAP